MATLRQILVVVVAAVALTDGFAVLKPEKVNREKRQATTQYPSSYTTYNYGTTSYPWNSYSTSSGYPWQYSTTYSPYQTTGYNNWNNYDTTYNPWRYDTTYNNWNNYDTTYNPWRYDTTYNNWNNYDTTYNPWRYDTTYDYWNYYYTTYNPWRYDTTYDYWNYYYTTYNPWNRYDYWQTQSPNRDNQDVLLEALAEDVVAEAREVVSGAEETLEKANDLEDAVFRADGEGEPRRNDYPIFYR